MFSTKHCKILCATVIAATIASFAMSYTGGRLGMPLSIGFVPLQIAPTLIILFSTIALFVICIVALVNGRNRHLACSALALSLMVLMTGRAVDTGRIFQIGFRHRIQSTISPAELREIARACTDILPLNGNLPGPKKMLWDETKHRASWKALLNSTSLGKLDPWMVIFNRTNQVEIAWGGALIGHWGVIVQKAEVSDGDVAPGINTFLTP